MSKEILTHEFLKSTLHYSIITGQFYWLKSRGRIKSGDIAANLQTNGYGRIGIKGKVYKAHRLAWFWVTSEWPIADIDHKNGIPNANYWLNLREATRSQNCWNTRTPSNNTSGYKGVTWYKPYQKWNACIVANKKVKNLGYFDDIESAYSARLKAEQSMHGDFARAAINP